MMVCLSPVLSYPVLPPVCISIHLLYPLSLLSVLACTTVPLIPVYIPHSDIQSTLGVPAEAAPRAVTMATTQRIQQRECSTTSGSLFNLEDHGLVQYHRSASSFMPFSQDLSALSASKKEEESRSFDNVRYLAVDEHAQAISRSSSLTFTLASGFYNRWLSVFGLSWIFLSIIMTALSALIYNPWILYFLQHFSIVLRSSYKFALYTYRDLMIFSWVTGEVCIAPVLLLHMLAPSTGWAHFMFTFRNFYPLPLGLSTLSFPLESLWLVSRPWYRFFNLDKIRSCRGDNFLFSIMLIRVEFCSCWISHLLGSTLLDHVFVQRFCWFPL